MGLAARLLLTIAVAAGPSAPAFARDPLGVFERWGAFRDARPLRCFAIAEPARSGRRAAWRPFASIATWPRLGRARPASRPPQHDQAARDAGAADDRRARFLLASGGAEAWAPDARVDAAIVAAMRGGSSMSVEAIDLRGRPFADTYRLRGAATAIDAAALGCARAGVAGKIGGLCLCARP